MQLFFIIELIDYSPCLRLKKPRGALGWNREKSGATTNCVSRTKPCPSPE
jgi:hypothetical protein